MRTLTWFLETVGPGANQAETYRLDGDYTPVRVWAHMTRAPSKEVIIDINANGESIFSYRLRFDDEKDADTADFASVQLSKDSLITLDVDDHGGGSGGAMTVGLEMDEA